MIASVVINLAAPSALGVPPTTRTHTQGVAAQSGVEAAAARVARVQRLVAEAETELQRLTVEAEAASDAYLQAQTKLVAAQERASALAAELREATTAVDQARDEVTKIARGSYMSADVYGTLGVILISESPEEWLQRAATLELLGVNWAEHLDGLEIVQAAQARAEQAAQDAVIEQDAAADAAEQAETAALGEVADAQRAYDAVAEEKADYERQLQQAEIRLLARQGAVDARAAYTQNADAERAQAAATAAANAAAAAAGRAVPPTTGRVTSCYGSRWGTMHYGVDIAAPTDTPVYAPEAGRVLRAGPARGFGLAVYIQHADNSITVYGHINNYFVAAGQQVTPGQQIAEVGNRGLSTGAHLHFEVHTGGLYQNRTDPVAWLATRGVSLGGGCG